MTNLLEEVNEGQLGREDPLIKHYSIACELFLQNVRRVKLHLWCFKIHVVNQI